MKETIGIGIIGTGFARKTQIPAFKSLAKASLVSVSSGNIENARSAAEDFSISHFSGDWRETVKHPDVDLVCITTPPNLHFEMTKFCLQQGKHVLCEKPMAMNVAEAFEMTRLADESGLLALIDHELRFTNGRMRAYQLISQGKIGKIRHLKYLFRNATRGDASLGWTWWSDIEQGGGALGAISSHAIDSICWFSGAGIKSISAALHTHIKERPFEGSSRTVTTDDENLLIMNLGDGKMVEDATASVSISLVEAGPYRNRIECYGTKGALRIEDGGEIYFADINDGKWQSIEVDLGGVAAGMSEGGWSRGFLNIAERIVEAISTGKSHIEHAATFRDGLEIQKVLDAARESNATGQRVNIKDI